MKPNICIRDSKWIVSKEMPMDKGIGGLRIQGSYNKILYVARTLKEAIDYLKERKYLSYEI